MLSTLKNICPEFIKKAYRRLTYKAPVHGWFGNYSTWAEAKNGCSGYDTGNILETVKASILKVKNGEAVYERDSVVFDEIQYSEPLLEAFQRIADEHRGVLNVIDFGGSLGSSYFQNRNLLKNIKELSWKIVEQEHFVKCGKEEIGDGQLKFYYTIEEALTAGKANVLFLSSVIQYFEKPYELIEKCCSYGIEYIIVDRTAFIEAEKERITIQIVPEFIYKASYPAWFFNEQRFVNEFSRKYKLIKEFDSKFDPREQLEDKTWSYRKGFVFKRIE